MCQNTGKVKKLKLYLLRNNDKVFNKYGLPVLDMIPRTERVSSWMGPEVYSPYNPISAICGFNTKIYKNEQNKVTAVDRPWNGG